MPAGVLSTASSANALIDYANLPYLGGGDKIDINNANIRVYMKLPGMYPTVAGKIVGNGPFKSVGDVYNIPGLSEKEKSVIKTHESKLIVKDEAIEYAVDKFNNGLYR